MEKNEKRRKWEKRQMKKKKETIEVRREKKRSEKKNDEKKESLLKTKVILEILGHVDDPRDLARASQVCQSWNECSRDASLWRRLPLSHWEFGIWRFHPVEPVDLPPHLRLTSDEEPQPSQLFDHLASSLLPTVMPMPIPFQNFYLIKSEARWPFYQLGGCRCSRNLPGQQQNFHDSTSRNTSGALSLIVHPISIVCTTKQ